MTAFSNDVARPWTFGKLPRPLVQYKGQRPPAPDWFTKALTIPCHEEFVEVDGKRIETLSWGDPTNPSILFIHGSMAHARWWHPIAQLLTKNYHVTAFSFSGMGNSEWRNKYSVRQMSKEARMVAKHFKLLDPGRNTTIIAHSFGGRAGAMLAGDEGENLLGTIFLDSLLLPELTVNTGANTQKRTYDSMAEALQRFRLWPDQPGGYDFVIDEIARAGLCKVGEKWTWRFDPDFINKLSFEMGWEEALIAQCPLAFIRGALSNVVLDEDLRIQKKYMPEGTVFFDIPNAHHHIMVEEPIALTTAITATIEGWRSAKQRKHSPPL